MKSHVNIMDSDIAYENVIVYHGARAAPLPSFNALKASVF